METIKVNMNPNPLDVQTIHASQNDGEARQWEFELHNNGELIDTSEITEQLVFKVYKGGTEQLLPENGSTPTTSPFKGDIRYPQGLLTDQEFTYRQSPTEEDGLAKITDIKGNTLNWNQQVETLITTQDYEGVTFTNNGDGSLTINGTTTNTSVKHPSIVANNVGADGWKASHRYYIELNNTSLQPLLVRWGTSTESAFAFARRNTEDSNSTRYLINGANIGSPLGDGVGGLRFRWNANVGLTFNNAKIIPQIFDLTEMFGTEKAEEIYQMEVNEVGSGVAYFRSLFPLPYCSYNQGSLLSFNGTGIKTVGKNLLMPSTVTWSDVSYVDGYYNINVTTDSTDERRLFGNWGIQNAVSLGLTSGTYIWTAERLGINIPTVSVRVSVHGTESYEIWSVGTSRYINSDDKFFILLYFGSAGTYNGKVGIQLEFGSNATSYEPYTESVINLPISTYFPTGMKDVPDYTNGGKIYDEMTSNRADTRVGAVDLGTLDWTLSSFSSHIFRGKLTGTNAKIPNANDLPNALLANYQPYAYNPISVNNNGCFAIGYRSYDEVDVIVIIDHNYSDRESFISHVSGQYLFYELATPTETSFTTASLVTENAEIPLSNDDGVLVGKCTEQLSENPGFIDAKIKLSDADGECYSNKIQLHVERSPQ